MKQVKENDIVKTLRLKSVNEKQKDRFQKTLLNKVKNEKFARKNIISTFFATLNKNKPLAFASSVLLILLISGITFSYLNFSSTYPRNDAGLINDWAYQVEDNTQDSTSNTSNIFNYGNFFNYNSNKNIQAPTSGREEAANDMGFSVGGAKDISNFRENIKKGYLPIPSDITTEGLFYDYYFDANKPLNCQKLFCPTYSAALTKDKFSGIYQPYITVGLNSGLKESDFKRPPLNLMIVLDISGSMNSPFDKYYYDRYGNYKENSEYTPKTKLEVAKETISEITKKLNADDSFGIVLFDDESYLAKPMRKVGETDMNAIRSEISKLKPRGGTNMESGLKRGKRQVEEYISNLSNKNGYENRIIFLTDAMPNYGNITDEGLKAITSEMAEKKIYTTFIGIGVDFNSELISKITNVKGANYFSLHSEKEFKQTVANDFDLIVTPLVFDLKLKLDSNKYEIVDVYGVPNYDKYSDGLINIKTLFPSRASNDEIKGGVILIKLRSTLGEKPSDKGMNALSLNAEYTKRDGQKDIDKLNVLVNDFDFGEPNVNYLVRPYGYDNSGIRKAILLSNYVNLIQNWLIEANNSFPMPLEPQFDEYGLRKPSFKSQQWERGSKSLVVSPEYKSLFREFKIYFENEIKAIGDDSLKREVEILEKLIQYE